MNVKNRNVQCLVDSGANNSIISDKLVHNLGLSIDHLINTGPLVAATEQRLCNLGKITINLYIKGLKVVHSFVVVKDLFPNFLIKADFLQKNSAVIDYANNTVTFDEGVITISLQCFNSIKNCACVHRTDCIPAFSEILTPVRLPKNYRGTELLLEPLQNNLTPVLVGGCITSVQNGIGIIRMLNFKPHPVAVKRKLLVASLIFS